MLRDREMLRFSTVPSVSYARATLNHACTEDLLNKNVTLHVVLPRRHRAERTRKAWTTDEARAFLESARSDRRASPTSLTLSAYLFLKVTATIYDFAVST